MESGDSLMNIPKASGIPTGYAQPSHQHVNYVGTDGDLHELWWNGTWHYNNLSVSSGAVGDDRPQGTVYGHAHPNGVWQHVYYKGLDNWAHELFWDGGSWHHLNLSHHLGAQFGPDGPCHSHFNPVLQSHNVYFVGSGMVHELWWHADHGWHTRNLSDETNAPASATLSQANGYTTPRDGVLHVNFRGDDRHIHELYHWELKWRHNDLTAETGAPDASTKDVPWGYVNPNDDTQHVNYIGVDGHVHELWWDGAWHHNDLSLASGFQRQATDLCQGYVTPEGWQHVPFQCGDTAIHILYWKDGTWSHFDAWDSMSGNECKDLHRAYTIPDQQTLHITYLGTDRDVHELWSGRIAPWMPGFNHMTHANISRLAGE
ncbi:hypothetical protein [Streptomyces xanthophaeus]|uniref:hypothetical protein n=1 Tax=Streptomyces xanthophaeus TaxID=67385 RepID=UPI00371B78B3